MTAPDPEVESAIRALAHRVYDRDQQEPGERVPPADFAYEFITALRGRGWKRSAPPAATTTAAPRPDATARGAAYARQVLAAAPKYPGGRDRDVDA